MATCGGWYYTKAPWHNDPMTVVTGRSQAGGTTKANLSGLALTNDDAKIFHAYLDAIHKKNINESNDRNPFGCAEPDAIYQLLGQGAQINQIFIGSTHETVYSDRWQEDVDRRLKPCANCQQWLTAELKDGSFMVDMGELNRFVRQNKLSW